MAKYRITAKHSSTSIPFVLEAEGPSNDALLTLLYRLEVDHNLPVGRISIGSFKFEEIIAPATPEILKRLI